MNTHIKKFSALIGTLIFAFGSSFAQDKEYDDLYFMPNDRNTVKKVKVDNKVVQNANQVQQLTTDPQENYSSKTVNPEYVARYQAKSQEDYSSDSDYSGDEYYDENYDNYSTVNDYQRDADVVVRDRYGNTTYFRNYSDVYWSDPSFYRGTVFDPFYSPYRYNRLRPYRSGWSVSFGFGNTWGWGNGWYSGVSVGYGWGSGWGGYYDPFYSYYDPFYCPPYYNSYYGYGYPYRTVVVVNNYETRSNRTIKRGPSTSRSGDLANNGRSGRTNTSSGGDISNGRSTTGRVATEATSRDYSDTQSRYYRRSREAVTSPSSNDNVSNGRTYSSKSRSTSNYSTESRNVNRSTRSSSSYDRSSENNNPNYNRSRSTNTNRSNYSTPTRSRSNNSGYNNNSQSNSRSSGYSSGSGSNSRSSGTSSYSSGSNSRSSGSSGRSSSGSSSRSRRGDN